MKFVHNPTQDDFGGSLLFVAEKQTEVCELVKYFKLIDLENPDTLVSLAASITAGRLEHMDNPKKRFWYAAEAWVRENYLKPYSDLLARRTLCGTLPDLDLINVVPSRLCHVMIIDEIELRGGMVRVSGFIQSEDWNGKSASDRAETSFQKYCDELFAERPLIPEFIQTENGQYSRNPDYATGKELPLRLGTKAEWLWNAVFEWWMENVANEAQKRVLKNALGYAGCEKSHAYQIRSYSIYSRDQNGACNYDGKGTMARVYSWEEFSKLK